MTDAKVTSTPPPAALEVQHVPDQDVDPVPEVAEQVKDAYEKGLIETRSAVMAQLTEENKLQAYELYLSTELTPEGIALQLGIPEFAVVHWIGREKWGDRKASYQLQLYKRLEVEHRQFVLLNRLTTSQRHLEIAKALEDEVHDYLTELRETRQQKGFQRGHDIALVRLSTALKNATDISARVIGLNDAAQQPITEEQRQTLIVVGGQARAPSAHPEKVINIDP